MCKIVILNPGVSIPFAQFENMVYNNPHGFGLILKDEKNKKLEVIRRCYEGGTSPKELFDLVEDNKDLERFLHVRWRTEGPIDQDNTHPFTAYYSDARQVYFMHNGTLLDFKPKAGYSSWSDNKKTEYPGENISDTKKFNDEFLAPLLLRMKGENGDADVHDPVFQAVVGKFWGNSGSKGLLIPNDLDPVLINRKEWKELDFGGGKFWSSNDSYFKDLSRGFEFERRKAEKEKKEKEESAKRSSFSPGNQVRRGSNGGIITDLKSVDIRPKEFITEGLANTWEDYNIWSEEGMSSLATVTEQQFQVYVEQNPQEAVSLLIVLTSYYGRIYNKLQKVQKYIEEMKKNGSSEIDVEKDLTDDV